ncbi:hypothetical protein [Acinetobacter junii]|uniref:hypothetical protein n=1 Tax=Acinetobacter junii TaxID=40215 RepID=UPI00100E4F97|nr:hypothetical protein [Acinetobacter junii]RXS92970.1 hypothetical protein ETZ13_14310 [Acinetobacter junii]
MPIPSNIRTPDTYIDINLNAERSGLPRNLHKVLFITEDEQLLLIDSEVMPVPIYDKTDAEQKFSNQAGTTEASKMITAAIKTNRTVGVECMGKYSAEM